MLLPTELSFARTHDCRPRAERDHRCSWRSPPKALDEPVLTGATDSIRSRDTARERGLQAQSEQLQPVYKYRVGVFPILRE